MNSYMNNLRRIINGDRFFQTVVSILMVAFLVIELYPLIYVVSASFSDGDAVAAGKIVLLPVDFTLEGYGYVFRNQNIWIGYANSIFYTVVGTFVNLVMTLPCAYALSRKELIGKNKIMIYFMITMYVSGGMVPAYLNMKSFGLLNTRLLMVIGGAISVYNMIVAKTFFENSIPLEITDASKIDGCTDFSTFSKIVLPLSKALMAVMVLYYGIGHWNSYFGPMIYLDDPEKYPLQLFLREILLMSNMVQNVIVTGSLTSEQIAYLEKQAEAAELTKYCVIVVAALPMMILYPKLQKFFEKGVMIGGVKG